MPSHDGGRAARARARASYPAAPEATDTASPGALSAIAFATGDRADAERAVAAHAADPDAWRAWNANAVT